MESGEIAGKTAVAICLLPELERNYTGGDLLYPNAQTRDLSPTQVLSDDQKQSLLGELAAIDKALTASPNDPGLLVAKAAVLQKYNLNAEAAEHLQKISGALPASVWARQRSTRRPKRRLAAILKRSRPGPNWRKARPTRCWWEFPITRSC
jgi:gluconate kinase